MARQASKSLNTPDRSQMSAAPIHSPSPSNDSEPSSPVSQEAEELRQRLLAKMLKRREDMLRDVLLKVDLRTGVLCCEIKIPEFAHHQVVCFDSMSSTRITRAQCLNLHTCDAFKSHREF
ncbi:unnamed protein product [Echinostoma caproni]|uniref:Uncharacterized protein n=1 Tax=Echinostoma caproni TaxID=27848 RepID=A0A3P8L5P0_9TREM|nr:unnamed protein product [Echinostoma caproni]